MIKEFQGEYRFLSNFWLTKVEFEDIIYPSVEHAYVAAKTLDFTTRKTIAAIQKAGDVKRFGRRLKIREDWEQIKLSVMEELVRQKFTTNLSLKEKLIATGEQQLEEGNTWGDTFWGVCRGVGQNNLGNILMKIREELRNE